MKVIYCAVAAFLMVSVAQAEGSSHYVSLSCELSAKTGIVDSDAFPSKDKPLTIQGSADGGLSSFSSVVIKDMTIKSRLTDGEPDVLALRVTDKVVTLTIKNDKGAVAKSILVKDAGDDTKGTAKINSGAHSVTCTLATYGAG